MLDIGVIEIALVSQIHPVSPILQTIDFSQLAWEIKGFKKVDLAFVRNWT